MWVNKINGGLLDGSVLEDGRQEDRLGLIDYIFSRQFDKLVHGEMCREILGGLSWDAICFVLIL